VRGGRPILILVWDEHFTEYPHFHLWFPPLRIYTCYHSQAKKRGLIFQRVCIYFLLDYQVMRLLSKSSIFKLPGYATLVLFAICCGFLSVYGWEEVLSALFYGYRCNSLAEMDSRQFAN